MGNRYSTTITFGGAVPESALNALAEAICNDGVGPDWNSFSNRDGALVFLRESVGSTITLCAHECNYGRMDSIEGVLKERGIMYAMQGDGDGCEILPYREIWRPDPTHDDFGAMTETSTDGQHPAISLDALRQREAEGKTLADVIAELAAYEPQIEPFSII